jgi:type IV pilus assembly protein PilY1
VLDTNGDGYADRMYVGDMAGQVWRFDIYNNQSPSNLVVGGVMASLGSKEETTHLPANTRRFYSPPDVAAVEKAGTPTFLNIAIGSGYRGHPLDTTAVDRMYSLRDYHPFDQLNQAAYTSMMSSANLVVDSTLQDITTQAQSGVAVANGSPGWKLLLNTHGTGEKVLVPARTFNDYIFFTTYSPNVALSLDPCVGVGSGTNRSYIVSVFNGNAVVDRNNSGTITVADRSTDLSQGGIAPETTFLFPAGTGTNSDGTQAGGSTGGSKGPVVCLQGVEVLKVCTNYDRRKKTYWREGAAN